MTAAEPEPQRDTIPPAALAICAEFEGFSATPYRCPAGVWTIGYGTTRYPDGRPVRQGDPHVTEAQARDLMAHDLADAADAVAHLVKVPLTDNQRAALLSFTYNLGRGALSGSTLLMKINKGDYDGAAGEFGRWVKAGGKPSAGLIRRRAAETALWLRT